MNQIMQNYQNVYGNIYKKSQFFLEFIYSNIFFVLLSFEDNAIFLMKIKNINKFPKDEEGNIVDQGIVVHEIDFDELTRTTDSIQIKEKENYNLHKEEIYIDIYSFEDVLKLQEEKADFLIYIYLPGCLSCAEFAPVLREYLEENEMTIYRMNINLASGETNVINRHIRYAPSIAVFNEGDLIAYLDVESEIDLPYYQSTEGLGEWLSQFIK